MADVKRLREGFEEFDRLLAGEEDWQDKPEQPAEDPVALEKELAVLDMDKAYADRDLNVGFSGGEKKKAEILQLLLLKPALAILDETDSGLDVDAVRTVSKGIEEFQKDKDASLLIITHNAAIADLATRVIRLRSGSVMESRLNEHPARVEDIAW